MISSECSGLQGHRGGVNSVSSFCELAGDWGWSVIAHEARRGGRYNWDGDGDGDGKVNIK